MSNSYQRVPSDGTMVLLDISIDYLDRDEITVYFDDVLTTAWIWSGTSDKRILFPSPVPNGVVVMVKRTTDASKLRHVFSEGAKFTAPNLDEDLKQALHMAQEASEANLVGDFFTDINMHGFRLYNVGTAVDDTDALTLGQYKADALGANAARVAAEAAAAAAEGSAAGVATLRSDLLLKTGATLVRSAFPIASGITPITRTVEDMLRQAVSIKDFGAVGDGVADDTAAAQNWLNYLSATKRMGYLEIGTYVVSQLSVPSDVLAYGAGKDHSTLYQKLGAEYIIKLADPGSPTAQTTNVAFTHMTFKGTVSLDPDNPYNETLHTIVLSGAKNFLFQHCKITGFRGDGIYVGTGNENGGNPTQERHNKYGRVLDCEFDGENKKNRNAISVIDCDTLWVQRNTFTRCSRPDQPGCVDIEPDSGGTPNGAACVVRNIVITHNKFFDNGGVADVAVNFPQSLSTYTTPIHNIDVGYNDFDRSATYSSATAGIAISVNGTFNTSRATPMLGLKIHHNTVTKFYQGLYVKAVRGVWIDANDFTDTKYSNEIGDSSGGTLTFDVKYCMNNHVRVSSDNAAGANALTLYHGIQGLEVTRNEFWDIGKANNGYNVAISISGGTKTDVIIEDNYQYSSVANANCWFTRLEDGAALTLGTTRFLRNKTQNVGAGSYRIVHDYFPTNISWQAPTGFFNSWGNFSGESVGFYKDSAGRVTVRGAVSGGTFATLADILEIPAGYRSDIPLTFVCSARSGGTSVPAYLTLQTNGRLQALSVSANTKVDLNFSYIATT